MLRTDPNVIHRVEADGSVLVMKLDNEEHLFKINGIAASFWTRIDGRRSLAQIKGALIRQFDPPRARFEADVRRFVSRISRAGLVIKSR